MIPNRNFDEEPSVLVSRLQTASFLDRLLNPHHFDRRSLALSLPLRSQRSALGTFISSTVPSGCWSRLYQETLLSSKDKIVPEDALMTDQ
jgi:hypothetical protein